MTNRVDLLKFYSAGRFDFDGLIMAIEELVSNVDGEQLMINYTEVNEILSGTNLKRNSAHGRILARALANLIFASAHRSSAEMSKQKPSRRQIDTVQRKYDSSMKLTDRVVDTMKLPININEILFAANREWDYALELSRKNGLRHREITVTELLPTTNCPHCNVETYQIGANHICGLCGAMV